MGSVIFKISYLFYVPIIVKEEEEIPFALKFCNE